MYKRQFLDSDLFPTPDESAFSVELTLPPGTPLERTDACAAELEKIVERLEGVDHFSTQIGEQQLFGIALESGLGNRARIRAQVAPEQAARINELIEEVEKGAAAVLPEEAELSFRRESLMDSTGLSMGLELIVQGPEQKRVEELSAEIDVYKRQYPDRMEIISYPGPMPGLEPEHFEPSQNIPHVPARNRRIGEFLKELRLAEARGTGIPKIRRKMMENGSPEAKFVFDEERSYFQVTLPVHPRYQVLHALREAAHLWAIGEKPPAVNHLLRVFERQPSSGALAGQLIEYHFNLDNLDSAKETLNAFGKQRIKSEQTLPYLTMARLLIGKGNMKDAQEVLENMPPSRTYTETVESAILMKRAKDFKGAHHLFTEAYSINPDDPKIIHEYAQTKAILARSLWRKQDSATRKRLNREAVELLRRAIQLSDDPRREAWCWFDLARNLGWLKSPLSEVEAAYLKAISLCPEEKRFHEGYESFKKNHQNHQRNI